MRILHTVESYYPSVGGAQVVVRQISERLAAAGHEVTVATSKLKNRSGRTINGVHIEEFEISGKSATGIRGEQTRYQEFLLHGSFDIMMNYAAQQWATDLVFPLLSKLQFKKVLAPCGFSALYNPAFAGYYSTMSGVMSQYEHLVFHSNSYRDIEFAKRHGLQHYSVIPNGAPKEEFQIAAAAGTAFRERYGIPSHVPMLLTVGSHTGQKGHALVIESFRRAKIGPAVLVLIGNPASPFCLADDYCRALMVEIMNRGKKRVKLLNPTRSDVIAAYRAADLFVFGSAVECSPLVLFEALASELPFVSSACGNAEEIVEWTDGGIVVPSTSPRSDGYMEPSSSSMARAIESLMSNPEERARLAKNGHRAWLRRFTWDKISAQYERLYYRLIRKH